MTESSRFAKPASAATVQKTIQALEEKGFAVQRVADLDAAAQVVYKAIPKG